MEATEYERLRSQCIEKFKLIPKDQIVFDACEVPKEVRIRLLDDQVYLAKTKAIRANMFIDNIKLLDKAISGAFTGGKETDQTSNVLKASEMKNKILFDELNVNKDESNALNVTFTAMSKEDFEALETVEVNEGSNVTELSADFGVSEDNDSFEARLKAETKQRLKAKEEAK